ncbi:MAG: TonB-dependent receptor [Vicinamibacteria bacterium]|nr:TonB-dependent receptor [Vicinamibacteria bacterium]
MTFSRALRMLLSLSLVALSSPLWAQQTGAISGKVTDTSGGVLPGVTVSARSSVLPTPRVTTTDGSGEFRMPALPPGEYSLEFTLSGMQTATRKAMVQLALDTLVNVKLGLQNVTENVEVTASVSLVDQNTASVTSGLSTAQLAGLPLGTEYRDLIKVIPGIQYSQDTVRGPSAGGSGQDNTYNFDGVNVTLPLFGTLSADPAAHDIAQVTVIKGGARAVDFDRSGGFMVDSLSKSGSSAWAGQVSFRLQNHKMSADLKNAISRFEQDKTWTTVNLGGPLLKDRLFFYGSYYRPDNSRENRANLYGPLPAYSLKRNEGFGKLTYTPNSSVLLNASYRQSKKVEESDLFASNAAATSGSGSESRQKIFTADGSWIINPKSYASFKFTRFENPGQGRPDIESDAVPSTTIGSRIDVSNLDKLGRFTVPTLVANGVGNAFAQTLIDRYGYTANGVKTGGGIVGYGLSFDRDDFYRTAGQVAYNLTFGGSVRHDLHLGAQASKDEEDFGRKSNGLGAITAPAGRTSFNGTPIFYTVNFLQQGQGLLPIIHSEYHSLNLEVNDTIRYKDWAFNLGVVASRDTLYGQGLKNDDSVLSGFTLALGNKYKQYTIPFSKMIQPRLGATWSYNGKDTIYASFAKYNPAVSSLSRAAAWDRNYAGASVNVHYDQNGVAFGVQPVASSSGKLFVEDMTPRTIKEYLVGTARELNRNLTGRVYGRYREGSHFWEDTNNNARQAFNPPAGVPRDLYIPNLDDQRRQIGNGTLNGSTYVIAELDGAYTKYWEGTIELEWHSAKTHANLTYTRSHYYGNFDQDNSTTGNDANIFIGSSNIADDAGRQLWDFKDGTLRGDRPHVFKLNAFRTLPWKATAGFFALAQSGQPWETWSYEPYRALTTSTSDTNRYAEKAGSRRSDSHYQLDLNYTQDIPLKNKLKLQLVANLFNVFDKQTGYNIQPSIHVPVTTSTLADGRQVQTGYGLPRTFFDPRRLELEARIRF